MKGFRKSIILKVLWQTVLISPKHKIRFIEAIKKINPQVEINTKVQKTR